MDDDDLIDPGPGMTAYPDRDTSDEGFMPDKRKIARYAGLGFTLAVLGGAGYAAIEGVENNQQEVWDILDHMIEGSLEAPEYIVSDPAMELAAEFPEYSSYVADTIQYML